MPLFGFKCTTCGKNVEKLFLHKVSSSLEEEVKAFMEIPCECGGTLVRIVGVPSLKFVGKDFYVTEERARKEKQRVANDIRTAKENIAKSERESGTVKST